MNVEIVLALKDKQYVVSMPLAEGATLRQAVLSAFQTDLLPNKDALIDPATAPLGIYGELKIDDYVINDGDRIEIYRPLIQDPKEWRRQRANKYKAR